MKLPEFLNLLFKSFENVELVEIFDESVTAEIMGSRYRFHIAEDIDGNPRGELAKPHFDCYQLDECDIERETPEALFVDGKMRGVRLWEAVKDGRIREVREATRPLEKALATLRESSE